jgi:hypothetical protein
MIGRHAIYYAFVNSYSTKENDDKTKLYSAATKYGGKEVEVFWFRPCTDVPLHLCLHRRYSSYSTASSSTTTVDNIGFCSITVATDFIIK